MSYEEYIDLLERLVEDGVLTLAEAEILATRYDEFSDIDGPITPENIPTGGAEIDFVTLAIIIAVIYAILRRSVPREQITPTLARFTYAQRTAAFGTIQDSFQAESADLARQVASGQISINEWHEAMNRSLQSHYRSAAYAAYGTAQLNNEQELLYRRAVLAQQAYLSRFADQYMLSVVRGEPWSEVYIANRSAMYAGPLRGFAYASAERDSGFNNGWVFYYIAVDDERTCDPCIEAMTNSPYLAGQGPRPGEVCDGKGRCRCRREPVYDPNAYQELVGVNA